MTVRSLLISAVILAAGFATAQAEPRVLVLATGPAAGLYYPVGGALCRVVNQGQDDGGVRCLVESTSGSKENLRRLADGEVDLALVQSDWQFYAPSALAEPENGQASDQAGPGNVRAVLSLQAQPLTLVAGPDSGISRLADLDGKRVNLAPPGSAMRTTSLAILDAMGWDPSDLLLDSSYVGNELVQALCDGEIDAFLLPINHPSALVTAATEQCRAELIALDDEVIELVERAWPFYGRAEIPGGLYPGVPEPVLSVGLRATLMATKALDPDLVFLLLESVFGGLDQLKQGHPVLMTLNQEEMIKVGNTLDFHDGAIRYYQENRLLTPPETSAEP